MSKRTRSRLPVLHLEVEATLKELRAAGQELRRTKSRYAPYEFLQHVYRIYCRWRNRGDVGRHKSMLLSLTLQDARAAHHPLRVLIDASNGSLEAKTKSRWTRALEYALGENVKPRRLPLFFRTNGGIAGCARGASKERPKHVMKRNDWV
jgi:hypothetical protein